MRYIFLIYIATTFIAFDVKGQRIACKPVNFHQGPFIHPGLAQSREDLEYMRKKVLSGEQPWKNAFDTLRKKTVLDFKPMAYTHISTGPYGANDIGGKELFKSAGAAYNHALMWWITGEKEYAQKAIEILNAWSYKLWDFDENNAKLSVGLTAYYFLNAAEILKYSGSGWKQEDLQEFKRMILTVYYPTVKDFFTEANGNWDASIINTLLCIGIFTDNHDIFNLAIERFHRGPGNSGITKYIYPNGQIQEATRDWGHVQLGIGEFAKAAQIAWTQRIDLYSLANDRLATGFEYTCKYMLGDSVPAYGVISRREMGNFRDIYESIYNHYQLVKGIDLPFTRSVIEKFTRVNSSEALLTAARNPFEGKQEKHIKLRDLSEKSKIPSVSTIVGAGAANLFIPLSYPKIIIVQPGSSIQEALDNCSGKAGLIILAEGTHILNAPLRIPSNIMLAGKGKKTILYLSSQLTGYSIINADSNMHNITIRDLIIEGAINYQLSQDPNDDRRKRSYMSAASRGGIAFLSEPGKKMEQISLKHLTIQNCTKNGVLISGADRVEIDSCDFSDNGSSVVPGAGFHHNLNLTHVTDCKISNGRFDASPWGNGINISFCRNVTAFQNEAARNKLSGIRSFESDRIQVISNLAEGNDANGILFESLMEDSGNINVLANQTGNNGEYGIYIGKTVGKTVAGNIEMDNGIQQYYN